MDWKNNKLIGIAAGILVLICVASILIPLIRANIQYKKKLQKDLEWMEYEKRRGAPEAMTEGQ